MWSPLKDSEFHALLALASGSLHGYGLVRQMELESDGRVRLMPGNLYAILRRLESTGLVRLSASRPLPSEDQRRRYYELTREGREALEAEAHRLMDLTDRVRARLGLEDSAGNAPAEG